MSPMTSATADSVRMAGAGMLSLHAAGFSTRPSKPRMRNCPHRVGKSASATFVTLANGMISLYVSVLMDIGFAMRGFDAGEDTWVARAITQRQRRCRGKVYFPTLRRSAKDGAPGLCRPGQEYGSLRECPHLRIEIWGTRL